MAAIMTHSFEQRRELKAVNSKCTEAFSPSFLASYLWLDYYSLFTLTESGADYQLAENHDVQ